MSLAKAIVTGTVYRNPEKRFTSSNIAIYSLKPPYEICWDLLMLDCLYGDESQKQVSRWHKVR